jgi:hypothetical protein
MLARAEFGGIGAASLLTAPTEARSRPRVKYRYPPFFRFFLLGCSADSFGVALLFPTGPIEGDWEGAPLAGAGLTGGLFRRVSAFAVS